MVLLALIVLVFGGYCVRVVVKGRYVHDRAKKEPGSLFAGRFLIEFAYWMFAALEKGAGCRRPDALVLGAEGVTGGPPEVARLLPLAQFEPAKWREALKSFPSLVREGVPGCPGKLYCDQPSRCAAIAQLRDGRLALFASQWPVVRRDVALFLAGQLGAVWAVNLDGGPEATLWVKGQELAEAIGTPGTPLPLVLVVEARVEAVAAPPTGRVVGAPQPDAGPRR